MSHDSVEFEIFDEIMIAVKDQPGQRTDSKWFPLPPTFSSFPDIFLLLKAAHKIDKIWINNERRRRRDKKMRSWTSWTAIP